MDQTNIIKLTNTEGATEQVKLKFDLIQNKAKSPNFKEALVFEFFKFQFPNLATFI